MGASFLTRRALIAGAGAMVLTGGPSRADAAFSVHMTHSRGEMLLRTRPRRILAVGYSDVAIARALVTRPTLLLVDELSLGLAPLVVDDLLDALRRVADTEGIGVVLVEQHVPQALRRADRAVVLVGGRVAVEAGAAELLADPDRLGHAYLGGSVD